ncbi:Phosphoadenosine phosphosulfate reductase family-domain-containing protein [Nemania sp. FL0031]|nr:Phosphoadenosine phosphosulfate reductase family-domain-containing protein [Nemania sp. FL0031]
MGHKSPSGGWLGLNEVLTSIDHYTTYLVSITFKIPPTSSKLKPGHFCTLNNKMQVGVYENPESGYGSSRSTLASSPKSPQITFTELHLKHLNEKFEHLSPQEILRMSKLIFPNLYQITAFGLTGLVTLDMLSKLPTGAPASPTVEIIFLDTLYHFQETHQLVARVRLRYPEVRVHIFQPDGCDTASEFEEQYGQKLWETNAEKYDYLAKVEPQQRSYDVLNVAAVLTGRRRSQGAARGDIPVVEIDHERGVVKINPLVNWSFDQVREYISANDVPYNELLDRGYKSIGDWHSTQPVTDGEDERAGRWKGQQKTECGIHNKKSRYAVFLMELAKKQAEEEAAGGQVAELIKPQATTELPADTAVDTATPAILKAPSPKTVETEVTVPALLLDTPEANKPGRKIGFSRAAWMARHRCVVQ